MKTKSLIEGKMRCELCKKTVPTITLEEHVYECHGDIHSLVAAWMYKRAKRLELLYDMKSKCNNEIDLVDINSRISELETLCG